MRAIIDQAVELGRIVCMSDPQAAAERDRALLAEGAPEPSPFPILRGSSLLLEGRPLAGHLAPQFQISRNGRRGRFDDVMGRGWLILTFDPEVDQGVSASHDLFRRLGGRVVTLSSDASAADHVTDLSGDYARFFSEHGLIALVVRPDFHIFGGAGDASELDAALRALHNILAADHGVVGIEGGWRVLAAVDRSRQTRFEAISDAPVYLTPGEMTASGVLPIYGRQRQGAHDTALRQSARAFPGAACRPRG